MTRHQGRMAEGNDRRGFGFIEQVGRVRHTVCDCRSISAELRSRSSGGDRCRGLFLALLTVIVLVRRAPAMLLAPSAVLSLAVFAMYRVDKAAAARSGWGTPKVNVHLMELLDGWPDALVAQRFFHHKTMRHPFVTIFWCTVLANCAALGWPVFATPLG